MATRYLESQTVLDTIVRPLRKLEANERHEREVRPYIEEVPAGDLRGFSIEGNAVETVFRGSDDHYDHVLIPTQTSNTYLVVIVDRANNEIVGHHVLNRNDLYDVRIPAR